MARKKYSDEFLRQAVDQIDDRPDHHPRTPSGRPETPAEKLARLEAENAQLRAEKAKVETEKAILRQAAKPGSTDERCS